MKRNFSIGRAPECVFCSIRRYFSGGGTIHSNCRTATEQKLRTQQTRFWSAQRRSEIVIKRGLRKLSFPDDLEDVVREESFELMPISFRHLRRLETLPELHRDPFDRMLVAQTLTEGVSLVTNDRALLAYGVPALW